MQNIHESHPDTPRTPGTLNTLDLASKISSYQQQETSQPQNRAGLYSVAPSQYPPPQGYGTSAAMVSQATTAASHPQHIEPATASGRGRSVLRHMPPGSIMPQPGVHSPYGPASLMQPQSGMAEGESPTHAVGSQGRRSIRSSASGPLAAPAAGTGTKNTVIPAKDIDGKFPCPDCTKTYLHAKHLKRHLLRHTGDRPYMCILCRDTFTRSDILKRHFQKCSIRRGNPTGASHLSDPQAHVKTNQQARNVAGLGRHDDLDHLNGLSNLIDDPFGIVPVLDGMSNMAQNQSQLSRLNSPGRLDNGNNADRRDMNGQVTSASQPYGAHPSMNQRQMTGYSVSPTQNGMPMYGDYNQNR